MPVMSACSVCVFFALRQKKNCDVSFLPKPSISALPGPYGMLCLVGVDPASAVSTNSRSNFLLLLTYLPPSLFRMHVVLHLRKITIACSIPYEDFHMLFVTGILTRSLVYKMMLTCLQYSHVDCI